SMRGDEIEPDEKNGGAAVQIDDDSSESPKITKKNILNYIPFMKKSSVSPHPEHDGEEDEEEEDEQEEEAADARSTLSCDTCSSAGSSDTEEEFDDGTDTPVTGATYAHRECMQNSPSQALGSTFITLAMEKVGLKNTGRIVCPFVRITVRDSQGKIFSTESPQETPEWEVVNKNYLRAPSHVHLQSPLEEFPKDAAIFLEVRHYRPQRNVISTLCYTFLEKQHLTSRNYICELYSVPVDFTRHHLKSYTEKAFFLHLEVNLTQDSREVQSLDSPKSSNSS
ncbi:hypothetical protein SK128_013286, partial [Halocaridina rubra]